MERIISPWRSSYIETFKSEEKSDKTFLQEAIDSDDYEKHLVLFKSKYTIILVNKFPYNAGHILIAPKREVNDILLLSAPEYSDINNLLLESIKILKKVLKPNGYNVGVNVGESAGAGLPSHLHYHIVPRWVGDNNFMPVIAEAKVISQSFEQIYKNYKIEFDKISG